MRSACYTLALAALAALGVAGSQAAWSQQDRHGRDRDQVCIYEHADYGGWEQCYGVGEQIRDLGNRRNQISSVRVYGRAEITLYEHPNFQGHEVTLGNDTPDFGRVRGWNDQTDSLRVDAAGFGGRPRPGQQRDDRVCVYQHVGFQGNSKCFDAGDDVPDLREIGWNDGISSIRTFGHTRVAFYEDNGFRGQRLIVERDIADLTQVSAGNRSNWNDRISSLRVSGDGPGRPRN